MKDKECRVYINTYKCENENCEKCEYRFGENKTISILKEIAFQTDVPIYKGDVIDDYYIRLSDVIDTIKKVGAK